jgi:Flagellar assembly protein T, C-terminal domain
MSDSNIKREILVVSVKSDISLVINLGSEHGIKEGDKFLIYHVDSEEMKDPITGESLGYLETIRGTGVADHVQPKMTTLKSNRKERPRKLVSRSGYGALASLMGGTVEYLEPETVPFDGPQVGDKVKKI